MHQDPLAGAAGGGGGGGADPLGREGSVGGCSSALVRCEDWEFRGLVPVPR